MKSSFPLRIVVLFSLISGTAFALPRYYKVDLQKEFKDESVNLYSEASFRYVGVDILIPTGGRDFTYSIENDGTGACTFVSMTEEGFINTKLKIHADLEPDNGTCTITIKLEDEREVDVSVENVRPEP